MVRFAVRDSNFSLNSEELTAIHCINGSPCEVTKVHGPTPSLSNGTGRAGNCPCRIHHFAHTFVISAAAVLRHLPVTSESVTVLPGQETICVSLVATTATWNATDCCEAMTRPETINHLVLLLTYHHCLVQRCSAGNLETVTVQECAASLHRLVQLLGKWVVNDSHDDLNQSETCRWL